MFFLEDEGLSRKEWGIMFIRPVRFQGVFTKSCMSDPSRGPVYWRLSGHTETTDSGYACQGTRKRLTQGTVSLLQRLPPARGF